MLAHRRTLALPLGITVALLAPLALAATTQMSIITNATPGHSLPLGQFDGDTYAMGDFDGDGKKEVVAFNDNQDFYVMSPAYGRILAEIRPDYPSGWGVRSINEPAVADVNGDGRPDIVVVDSAAVVCVYDFVSGASSTSMTFAKQWCHRMDAYMGGLAAADAGPAVADVNGDGKMEIFSNTEDKGLFAFNWDGTTRWSSADYGGNAGPLVTDLENDGKKDVIFFGDGGEVRARDASTGGYKWTFYANKYVTPASIPEAGNAADLDGDGQKEVVFFARDAHDATNFTNDHFGLFVLGANGALKWWAHPAWGNPMSYTHPALVDVSGDGKPDIVAMDWNTIGHKPGNWEVTGSPHVFAYSGTGTLLWKDDISDTWSNDDVVIADATGDGQLDVLAIGRGSDGDGVWYINARTGAFQQHVSVGAWTALRGPVAGDLDGSGKLSWALSIHSSSAGGGFAFFRTDAPCAGPFLGWHGEANCGAAAAPPPPPPPPPTGGFAPTFTPTGANEWWIQVHVTADRPLAGVDTRINGGAWQALTLQSWGDWAKSYHAPSGSIVQFQARATDGSIAESGCYHWTDRAPVACTGTPPPPTGTFAATFKNVRGNEWWVETDVTVSGGTLAGGSTWCSTSASSAGACGVDARVNGGAWVALAHQSYGSWAKSIHAVAGSTVEFRARATDGQTAQSGAYAWPPA